MTEMIERVAKAISEYQLSLKSSDQESSREAARRAIAAMREPTEEMKACSEEVHWDYSCHVCGGLKDGWYQMVDAALGKTNRDS
jgi:hypothetical protein